ncbi:MAG: PIN domain-containing protein [Thermomicrobiales bacterium]|nr:PIN domain-containing protein [Thermomicrobiales bacterium]
MRVFLDTSVVKAEGYYFQSISMKSIIDVADQLGIELLVPDVVYEEARNLHENDIAQQLQLVRKALTAIDRISRTKLDDKVIGQLESQADQMYWGWLMNTLLKSPFRRAPLPEINNYQAMIRAIEKGPPFGGKNDGYRDYLIWMTIVDEVINGEGELPVHFITQNVHDFAEDSRAAKIDLHHRLKLDLEAVGVRSDSVVLHRTALEFRCVLTLTLRR